jgi:dienelactone hydrolase
MNERGAWVFSLGAHAAARGNAMQVTLNGWDVDAVTPEGFCPVRLDTDHGPVEARHYPVPAAAAAVIWVGGGDGFDSPARGLYPRLGRALQDEGLASLQLCFRRSAPTRGAVCDGLAGLEFLRRTGMRRVGLVGHSLGGAVVVQLAGLTPEAGALVLLATQSYGAASVGHLGPRCAMLLIHGAVDPVLPPACSETVFAMARYPKKLELIAGARHQLDEAAGRVEHLVHDWLVDHLHRP